MIANPGDEAILSCSVEGKPLNQEHVRWERIGYNMGKTEISFVNGTSYLHIKNAQREDVGNFRCVADNRIANPTSRDVLLIVKCKFPLSFLYLFILFLFLLYFFLNVCSMDEKKNAKKKCSHFIYTFLIDRIDHSVVTNQ